MEAACQQKDKELKHREKVIQNLHKKMESMKKSHQMEIEELKLAMEQKLYLAQKKTKTPKKIYI